MAPVLPLHRPVAGHPLRRRMRFAELKRRVRRPPARLTIRDGRDFLLAYGACLLAVSAFIA